MKTKLFPSSLAFVISILCIQFLAAQQKLDSLPPDPAPTSIFSHLEDYDIFDVELKVDLKKLVKEKHKDEYQPALISYTFKDQRFMDSVEVKPRGKSRRKICSLPPIKLKFPKSSLKEKGLKKFSTLKVVNHCRKNKSNEQIILKEYLIYKMYQHFTDSSFRVQLLKVNYVDTGRKGKKTTRHGFVIEHEKELAERIGGKIHEANNVAPTSIDTFAHTQFCLFQMMIGNTDWQIVMHHNTKTVRPDSGNCFVVVPYDFDYCGLVNAYYAIPNKGLDLKSVRDRLYMGLCLPMEDLMPVIKKFNAKKETIYKLIDDFDLLDNSSKKEMKGYLNEFYSIMNNTSSLNSYMRRQCMAEN